MHLPLLARHPRAQSACSTALPCLALLPVARPAEFRLQPYHNEAVASEVSGEIIAFCDVAGHPFSKIPPLIANSTR